MFTKGLSELIVDLSQRLEMTVFLFESMLFSVKNTMTVILSGAEGSPANTTRITGPYIYISIIYEGPTPFTATPWLRFSRLHVLLHANFPPPRTPTTVHNCQHYNCIFFHYKENTERKALNQYSMDVSVNNRIMIRSFDDFIE